MKSKKSSTEQKSLQKQKNATKTYILLSGGIDSAACVKYFISQNHETSCIFVDYGQMNRKLERLSAQKICDILKCDLALIEAKFKKRDNKSLIQGRNLFLISSALMLDLRPPFVISLGIHADTPYRDCSEVFVKASQNILDVYYSGEAQIDCPFLSWTKSDILKYAKEVGLPINLLTSTEMSD